MTFSLAPRLHLSALALIFTISAPAATLAASHGGKLNISATVQRYCEVRPNQAQRDLGLRCAGQAVGQAEQYRNRFANTFIEGNTLFIEF